MGRDFNIELDTLLERNYYSEEPELFWALREFDQTVTPGDRAAFTRTMLDRLAAGPSLSDVFICGCIDLPESAPLIAEALNREDTPSQLSRTMMQTLRRYPGDLAFSAVERFLDSSQEIDALQHLAAMDFERSLPHLRGALLRDHLLEVTLHILARVLHDVGWKAFEETLQRLLDDSRSDRLRARIDIMVGIKPDGTNPFETEEIERVRAWLNETA